MADLLLGPGFTSTSLWVTKILQQNKTGEKQNLIHNLILFVQQYEKLEVLIYQMD